MCALRQVSIAPIVDLLRWAAPGKSEALDQLMAGLRPHLQLDNDDARILFQADSSCNTITVGVQCTCRLQAHAYAYAIALSAQGTPGYLTLSPDERKRLYSPADPLLNWAVSRDLQQWLAQIEGAQRPLEDIFAGAGVQLPNGLLSSLKVEQRALGERLFRIASAFILLHELAHLDFRHVTCKGSISIQQEKDADRFAAEWLMDPSPTRFSDRMARLYGIAVALLWLTVFEVFLGPRQRGTHPSGYDRLYQVLDQVVDRSNADEELWVWDFVKTILLVHIDRARIEVEAGPTRGSPRDQVNYLIDLISKKRPW